MSYVYSLLLGCCKMFAMTIAFSWQNSISLCPASLCTPRPYLPVTPGISWLPTFWFQFLCPRVPPQQGRGQVAIHSWASSNIGSSLLQPPFQATPAELMPWPWATCWSTPNSYWRFTQSTRTICGTTRAPGMSSSYVEQLKGMALLVWAWKKMVHWRRK